MFIKIILTPLLKLRVSRFFKGKIMIVISFWELIITNQIVMLILAFIKNMRDSINIKRNLKFNNIIMNNKFI